MGVLPIKSSFLSALIAVIFTTLSLGACVRDHFEKRTARAETRRPAYYPPAGLDEILLDAYRYTLYSSDYVFWSHHVARNFNQKAPSGWKLTPVLTNEAIRSLPCRFRQPCHLWLLTYQEELWVVGMDGRKYNPGYCK